MIFDNSFFKLTKSFSVLITLVDNSSRVVKSIQSIFHLSYANCKFSCLNDSTLFLNISNSVLSLSNVALRFHVSNHIDLEKAYALASQTYNNALQKFLISVVKSQKFNQKNAVALFNSFILVVNFSIEPIVSSSIAHQTHLIDLIKSLFAE